MRLLICLLLPLALSAPASAWAWTRPGHMVSAAIAWDEIAERRPALLAEIGPMLSAHPDRGPFQVAIDRTTGLEQARRQFLECARWPDDARGTTFDHPSWHVALRPVDGEGAPRERSDDIQGEAIEAFALAFKTLSSPLAGADQRSQALCWVLHIGGDIHQPLHAAQLFSSRFPKGDGAGGRQFVRDPMTGEPISLHWLWDDSVHRSGLVAEVDARAADLRRRLPRASLPEARKPGTAADLPAWIAEESYPLARDLAYGDKPASGTEAATAQPVAPEHWARLQAAAERRLTIAGYRLADLVIEALDD